MNMNSNKNIITNKSNFSNANGKVKNIIPINYNIKRIIITILIIILIVIIIYLIICVVKYSRTQCYKKKEFMQYIIDFKDSEVCLIKNEPIPVKPIDPKPKRSITLIPEKKKEVFHLSNQDYTYEQAKCKCESYGATLATKAQITDAYNNGANWCTYGWTDNQSAYYPVQQCEYDKLQIENERLPDNEKKYCGIPGINGGFFPNPGIKFGTNCYGIKPEGQIASAKAPYCPPMNFCKLEQNFQASNKLDTDNIVSFNNEQWNMNM